MKKLLYCKDCKKYKTAKCDALRYDGKEPKADDWCYGFKEKKER